MEPKILRTEAGTPLNMACVETVYVQEVRSSQTHEVTAWAVMADWAGGQCMMPLKTCKTEAEAKRVQRDIYFWWAPAENRMDLMK